jgi:Domain of unknown function (DUF4062)
MADVKIFLSCVSDEFGSYREALRHALTHKRVEVKIQEDFQLPGGDTLAMLEDYIASCDVVVHFVGDMAGSVPAATSVDDILERRPKLAARLAEKGMTREALGALTYTQWEAWLAVGFNEDGKKKNLVIVAPTESAHRDPNFAPTKASYASQAEHLRHLKANDLYPGPPFNSTDNLTVQVLTSAVLDAVWSVAGLTVKETPSGVALQTKSQMLLLASVAGVFAVLAGISIFVFRPQSEAEKELEKISYDRVNRIAKLKQEESDFFFEHNLLSEQERLEKCVDDKVCAAEELQTFNFNSVKEDKAQRAVIKNISDFYLDIVKKDASGSIPHRRACTLFAEDIYKWQRAYYFVLKDLEGPFYPFQKPLADFSIDKCEENS